MAPHLHRLLDFTQEKRACSQCSLCRLGALQVLDILKAIAEGDGKSVDIDALIELGEAANIGSNRGL